MAGQVADNRRVAVIAKSVWHTGGIGAARLLDAIRDGRVSYGFAPADGRGPGVLPLRSLTFAAATGRIRVRGGAGAFVC